MVCELSKSETDILRSIPLLCEGVVGIGVFVFLLLVKKVCRLNMFLHASTFLTLAASIMDLIRAIFGQSTNTNFSQDLVLTREVLLLLAYPLLNLYFWELVLKCPRNAPINSVRNHYASNCKTNWRRGPQMTLKWVSVSILLTIPGLQVVWRLIPGQQQYSSIYVADFVLETTLFFIFILIFILNAYVSPSRPFWQALRPKIAPILILSFFLGLSVGNLLFFNFSDTLLGRFLHAVGIYVLLFYNLYANFQGSALTYSTRRDGSVLLDQRSPRPCSRHYLSEKPIPLQDIQRIGSVERDEVDRLSKGDGKASSIAIPPLSISSLSPSIINFPATRASSLLIQPEYSNSPNSESDIQGVAAHVYPQSVSDWGTSRDIEEGQTKTSPVDSFFWGHDGLSNLFTHLRGLEAPPADIPIEESRSNISSLSLSIFPRPPSNLDDANRPSDQPQERRNGLLPVQIRQSHGLFPEMLRLRSDSTGSHWDLIRNLTIADPIARLMVASMYTQSGVGSTFPTTYSQLVTSPVLDSLCIPTVLAEDDDEESQYSREPFPNTISYLSTDTIFSSHSSHDVTAS